MLTADPTSPVYEIHGTEGHYYITLNGEVLRDSAGWTRYFSTRNAARKRISRERRQSFHK